MKQLSVRHLTILGICVALNYVGATIALFLRLPVYLDAFGTVLASFLLGPVYGACTGVCSALLNFAISDPYALYYAPVQIILGLLAGVLYRSGWLRGGKFPAGIVFLTIPGTAVSSLITAYLFGGITSSGSSLLVQLFHHAGLNLTASVFAVQILTDGLDRLIVVCCMLALAKAIPADLRR